MQDLHHQPHLQRNPRVQGLGFREWGGAILGFRVPYLNTFFVDLFLKGTIIN